MIKVMTDENVDSILNTNKTFLVLFQNENAPNTENILSMFEEFDNKFQGKIDVYRCDYFENQKVAAYFKTRVLPAMTMMKKTKIYANVAGPVSVTQYTNAITDGIKKIMEEEEYNSLPDNEYTI